MGGEKPVLLKRREDDWQHEQGGRMTPRTVDVGGPCIEIDVDDETMIVLNASEVMAIVELAAAGVRPGNVEAVTDVSDALKRGMIEGVTRFAWWKDGTQCVGTTGKTLAEAIADIEAETALDIELKAPDNGWPI